MKNRIGYDNRHRIFAALTVLALVTVACSVLSKPLVTKIKTGPTQTVDIQVPLPKESSSGVELTLEFLAGELKLAPGASGSLVSGTATFNVADFKPIVEENGSTVRLRSGDLEIEGIPSTDDDVKNEWDLQLGGTPMSLQIEAGAYSGNFELGGLSLTRLSISDGGADVKARFSEPNQVEMSSFTYGTGASSADLRGLANANFEQMSFTSGAGDYTLSFDGDLQRDASVTIDAGVGTVNLVVPEGVNARVTMDGGLTAVNLSGGWVENDKVYSLSGSGPTLTITVKMGAGTLNLTTG